MRHLLEFEDIGINATILQHFEAPLTQLKCLYPMVILVEQGTKVIEALGEKFTIKKDEILIIPAGLTVDIINLNAGKNSYSARYFSWQIKSLQYYEGIRSHRKTSVVRDIKVLKKPSCIFRTQFLSISEQLENCDNIDLILHKFIEMLIYLEQEGVVFSSFTPMTLTEKITMIIAKNPSRKWKAKEIATHFYLSESTMRRRLFIENSSFSNIIQDVRTSYGLTLLQTTNRNIENIAQEVGYDSGSRFAYYFKQRFGFLPREIREKNHI